MIKPLILLTFLLDLATTMQLREVSQSKVQNSIIAHEQSGDLALLGLNALCETKALAMSTP